MKKVKYNNCMASKKHIYYHMHRQPSNAPFMIDMHKDRVFGAP